MNSVVWGTFNSFYVCVDTFMLLITMKWWNDWFHTFGMVMYNYLKKITSAFSVSEHIFVATIIWHSVPGADVAISRHWFRGLNSRGTASPSLRKDQEWCHRLRRANTSETSWLGLDAKPADVARTAELNTKIYLYIRKSFKCLLMIFLTLIQQCFSSVHGADLVSIEWQLNWLKLNCLKVL